MTRFNFYLINILFCISLQAQESQNNFINEISIEKLRKGKLLVRLESKENKIQFLETEMNVKDCDDKCKERLKADLNEIIEARDLFNLHFIKSFGYYFKFCPVYFYYDKDHQQLANSNFNGNYYLNEYLEPITVNTINKDSLLILKKDFTPNSEKEGWLFQTVEGVTLKNGFPYVTENSFRTVFTWLSSSNHEVLNCRYLVKKLNNKLYGY